MDGFSDRGSIPLASTNSEKPHYSGFFCYYEDKINIELQKWTESNKSDLTRICNAVDRRYLSNRLPYPYTEMSDARVFRRR